MKRLFVFVLISFSSFAINAQNLKSKKFLNTPIKKVLQYIEEGFQIKFSYDSKLIENKKITFTSRLTLIENIKILSDKTGFQFKKINDSNIVIKNSTSQTQTVSICGYIKDNILKKTIENVSVFNQNKSALYITNKEGYFEIYNINLSDIITFKVLGYKTLKLSPKDFNKTICNTFFLSPQVENLNEVIISNYINSGFTKYKNGTIKATIDKVSILPGLVENDVLQMVQLIPGVQSPDDTATGLNIRGSTSDHNLILFDGIKMYHYDHFFGMLTAFNNNIINTVKLSKSSSDSKYRSHIAGVIDIGLDNEVPKKINAGFGTNMVFADAYLKVPITEKTGAIVSARRSFTDIFETVTFDAYSDHVFQNTQISNFNDNNSAVLPRTNNTYYFEDYTLKFIHKFSDKSQINFSSIYSFNNLDFTSQFTDLNFLSKDKLKIKNLGLNLNYSKQWNKKFKTNITASFSNYNLDYNGNQTFDAFFSFETVKDNQIKELNISIDSDYKLNKNSNISFGYDYITDKLSYTLGNTSDLIFESDFRFGQENTKNNIQEIYGQYYYNKDKWTINSGIRTSYVNIVDEIYIQPNFNIRYALNSNLSFQLSADKKNQYVSQIVEFETQNFGLENHVWASSNGSTIPILENKQISLSTIFKKDSWYLDIEGFIKQSKGLTSLTKGFNRNINELTTGKSNTKGLEFLVKKQFKSFSTLLSYTLMENRFKFNNVNNNNSFSGNFDIRHYLNIVQSYKLNDFELSAGWRFKSPRLYTPANGLIGDNANNIRIDYKEVNSGRLGDYSRFDLSSTYTFKPFKNKNIKAKIGASLLNIFNKRNDISRNYRIVLDLDGVTFRLREINKFSILRTPNIMFRLDF